RCWSRCWARSRSRSVRSTWPAASWSPTACCTCSSRSPESRSAMHEREAFDLAYLACAAMFIYGLKQLASPRTAVRGTQVAAAAMVVVIVVTLWDSGTHNLVWIFAGMAIGGAIGAYSARAVKMTAMPQMVALFNGVGGGAAALIAFSEFHIALSGSGTMT